MSGEGEKKGGKEKGRNGGCCAQLHESWMSKAQDTCSPLWEHLGSNTESAGERPCVLRPPQRRSGGQWGVEQHTANLAPLYSELMEFNFLKLNFTYLFIFAYAGSSLRLYRLLTQWAVLWQGTGCRHAGFSIAAYGLSSCGTQALDALRHVGSSPTRDWTQDPCTGRRMDSTAEVWWSLS